MNARTTDEKDFSILNKSKPQKIEKFIRKNNLTMDKYRKSNRFKRRTLKIFKCINCYLHIFWQF